MYLTVWGSWRDVYKRQLYTTAAGERAGLGFAVMESFMDKVRVHSKAGQGTSVILEKRIAGRDAGRG